MKKMLKQITLITLLIYIILFILFKNRLVIDNIIYSFNTWFGIIPSLIPFMFISSFIIINNYVKHLKFFLKYINSIFNISYSGSFIFLMSLICGYPTNAKLMNDMYLKGNISIKEMEYLICFCYFPNPLFIILVSNTILNINPYKLLSPMYISNIIIGLLFRKKDKDIIEYKYSNNKNYNTIQNIFSILIMILGYIIIYNFILLIIKDTFSINNTLSSLINGLLEYSSGLISLVNINNIHIKIILFYIITSFGGFCVISQIKNILSKNISYRNFYISRFIAMITSIIIYWFTNRFI